MQDLTQVSYHPLSEMMTEILRKKTQKENIAFFRVQVAYYLGKVASMMRCSVQSSTRNLIPVNVYAINLAPSGAGKGHSTGIIEREFLKGFKDNYMATTFKDVATMNLARIALDRHSKTGNDQEKILKGLEGEFHAAGNMLFSFDEATPAAIKQFRHKLLLAGSGSICLEIDEIGSNLIGNTDVITAFLELYDTGLTKTKLVKNTNENTRVEEIDGSTPANTLWYGTPSKLLDGGKTEDALFDFFETGYARRCIYAYTRVSKRAHGISPAAQIAMLNDPALAADTNFVYSLLERLADPANYNKVIDVPPDVEQILIEYKDFCEDTADRLKEHEEIRKAEVSHRYFKVLKLAGVYAFVDGLSVMSEDHLYAAMKLVEDSGEAFHQILTREKPYVKVARYIADIGEQVTQADMVEELPCFRGSASAKQELMTLAIAWGYKNNIIIKKHFEAGIEFFAGESIKETDLDKMLFSYSSDVANGYMTAEKPFFALKKLFMQTKYSHFTTHALNNGTRNEQSVVPGFNLLILDVDGTSTLSTVQLLLKDFMYAMYTTKSHGTNGQDRFRVVLPMSHILKLDAEEYKEFMNNIYEWLPFEVDTSTAQRSRKWRTWNGTYYENTNGEMFNVLPFIPKTTQNEERRKTMIDLKGLNNLERWFVTKTGTGNRSNNLIKYALICVDQGYDYPTTFAAVQALNSKLQDPVSDKEILDTIMVTAAKRINDKAGD